MLLFAAVVGAMAVRGADDAPWRVLETPRFRVLSQLPEGETRAWAGEFDQFVRALGEMVPVDESALAPLSVVLFARDADFSAYKPQGQHGKRSNHVGGFFASRDTWSVIGLADRGRDTETRETIFHEGVHWFTSNRPGVHPVWYDEGLADVFSTFQVEDGHAVWGAPPSSYVEYLTRGGSLPLAQVLRVRRGDALLDDEHGAAAFYARSWSLVHYTLFGRPAGDRAPVREFLAALEDGAPVGEAFSRAFAEEMGAMDRTLDAYVANGTAGISRQPFTVAAATDLGGIREADTVEVEAALARLALGAGQLELAGGHVNRILERAPQSPLGCELAAMLASEAGDDENALAASVRAVELGTADAAVFMILGDQNFRLASAGGELAPEHARGIANIYLHAIKLRPTLRAAYRNLARLACSLETLTERDLAALEQGRRLFPGEGEIPLGLAILAVNRGDAVEASRLLAEALKPAAEMSDEAREAARALASHLAS